MKIILPKTFKLIESKLHNYNNFKYEIEMWKQETMMSGGGQKENIHSVGYVSDPTASKALKLISPPYDIKETMDWIDVIEKTIDYAKKHNSYKVYFIWYEDKAKKTFTSAHTKLGMPERTFRNKRWNIVNYAGVKALEKGLIKRLYESF